MQIDPKTGVPLFNARDLRPIRLRLTQKDGKAVLQDSETERPLLGVLEVNYRLTKNGAQTVIVFAGPALEVLFDDEAETVRLPAKVVNVSGRSEPLFDGEEIPVVDDKDVPIAVLRVELLKKPEAQPAS